MKTSFSVLAAAALMLVASSSAFSSTPAEPLFPHVQNDPLFDQETYQALHDVVIDVSWKGRELGKAVRDLTLAVRTARPISADINFFISSSAPPSLRKQPVSLVLKRVPLFNVLGYLADQAGVTIKIHPGVVLIIPR